jgi:hypothetical protein
VIKWIKEKLRSRRRKKGAQELQNIRKKMESMTEEEFNEHVKKCEVK